MDEIKWYENCPLDSIKNIIKDNINTASRSFVAIGYYLKNVRDRKLYQQDGYQNIWEFAQTEFGIGKSSASRFMAINDRFSKDGNSPILLEQYKDFSSSKLSEMLTMSDEQLEQVTLTTTVAEIREIKNHEEVVATSQQEAEKEFKECKFGGGRCNLFTNPDTCTGESRCNSNFIEYSEEDVNPYGAKKPEVGTVVFDVGGNGKITRFEVTSKYCSFSERYFTVKDKFGVIHNLSTESEHWHYSKDEAKKDIWYHEKKPNTPELTSDIPASVNDTAEMVDNQLEIINETDEAILHERECSNCNYNDITPEEFKAIHPDGGFPCNECDDKMNHWIPKIEMANNEYEQDEPEIVEADIIQTASEEDKNQEVNNPERYTSQDIQDELNKLIEYVGMYRKNNDTASGRRKAKMRLDAIVLLDEEMSKPPVVEEPELAQPELPVLKNNDQRKEWAENYKSWGEWYYDENIDCHYYKFDFPNGDRLVVEEYLERDLYWGKDKRDSHFFHLLQKERLKYEGKKTYEKKYEHDTTSMTEIVEYLKEIQKKGAS